MLEVVWPPHIGPPSSLSQLHRAACDGTLLSALIHKLVTHAPVPGCIAHPRTQAIAVQNVSKCVTLLRGVKEMSKRHLHAGVVDAVCEGVWEDVLGVLEDV